MSLTPPSLPGAPRNSDADRARLTALMRVADPQQGAELQQSADAAREAMLLARQAGLEAEAERASVWLAKHLCHLSRHDEAMTHARVAMGEDSALTPALRVEGLGALALSASELSRFDLAIDAAQTMHRVAAIMGDPTAMLRASCSLAMCFDRMGDGWQARRLLSKAIEQHAATAGDGAQLMAWNALSAVCAETAVQLRGLDRDDERADVIRRGKEAAEQALAIARRMAHAHAAVVVQSNLCELLIASDASEQALAVLGEALVSAEQMGLVSSTFYLKLLQSDALLATGAVVAASALIEDCLAQSTDEMPASARARAHMVAARIAKANQDFERAVFHLESGERLERGLSTRKLRLQSELLVTRAEELQARREAEAHRMRAARLEQQTEQDALTGAGNRRFLERWFAEVAAPLQATGSPLALVMIDVDHFKQVNDTHGHAVGDAVLVALAQLAAHHIRQGDVFARLGGEEFVIVLPDTTPAHAAQFCERLRGQIEALRVALPGGGQLGVTISQGLALAPPYALPDLMARADAAMYAAKQAGRNRVELAPPGP